jgi:hypothetical protein
MRRDKLYLSDIVQAADGIARFIAGVEPDAFAQSDLLRSAVVHKLSVIGEAAARVSEDLKIRNPQVPWGADCRISEYSHPRLFRNRLGAGMAGGNKALSDPAQAGCRDSW